MISGLLIAAGMSTRMGKFKPLMEFDGKTFIAQIIDKLLRVCENVVVVTGHNSDVLEKYLEKEYNLSSKIISLIKNENYHKGMFSSIKRGAEFISDSNWVFYHLVDQPDLPFEFYEKFIMQIEDQSDWIQPTFKGKKGHPILFGNNVLRTIIDSDEKISLREMTRKMEINIKYWNCNYSSIFTDLDTPTDVYTLNNRGK